MVDATLIPGIVAAAAVALAFYFSRRFEPDHAILRAIGFTLAASLIPPIVYTLIEFKHPDQLFWWGMAFAAVLALLMLATRASHSSWAISLGIRGLRVWIGILLASLAVYGPLLRYEEIDPYCWMAVFFGVLVGASEIISRYRDEPWEALVSVPGLVYQAINGAISAAAFALLQIYHQSLFPALADDPLLTSILAGFGAMVVMRSKLFSFKTSSGEEFAVGPDAVITIFLRTVDRAIDRWLSINRQRLVFQSTKDIVYSPSVPDFLGASLAAYQNLSKEEKAELNKVIDEFAKKPDLDPQLKLMAMAFGFLNISGEDNYSDLVADLRAFLTRTTTTTAATPAAINFSAHDQPVALSAIVISSAGAVSEGTVTFTVTNSGGTTIGAPVTSGAVAGGATPATIFTFPASTPAGTYIVKAVYNGTTKFTGSTGSSPLTVN